MKHDSQLDSYMDAKWNIKRVVAEESLSMLEKRRSIKALLTGLSESGHPSARNLGTKGRVYAFLFRHRLATVVLGLELALAHGIKGCLPTGLTNHLRYRLMSPKGIDAIHRTGKTAFVFMVPDLGNLGDLAIGVAQKTFLQDYLKGYSVVEIPHGDTYEAARFVKRQAQDEDVIFLTGGGNLGTLYRDAELQRRFLIATFPHNKIIQFPQSMFFERTRAGERFLEQSIAIYSKHPDLTLIARDKPTLDLMLENFPRNRVRLCPDTVLHLSPIECHARREDQITLSIRRDIESNLSSAQIEGIEMIARDLRMKVEFRDTNVDNLHHALSDRMPVLDDIWQTYMRSKIVITDRLHGVIFCAITGTPCVAVNNSNGKVGNLIRTWLSCAPYIVSIAEADSDSLRKELDTLLLRYPDGAKPVELKEEFQSMLSVIMEKERAAP
ncbi:polysaccharide pyruvyl transferase family protein [Stenotrophomonas sp. TWI602]|uniref:polysaccharide pyruvyl transferase family protein n=1 Tax=Stenotrophomonas sp. TWI602 TaxID=3136786 RepID=UPI00320B0883